MTGVSLGALDTSNAYDDGNTVWAGTAYFSNGNLSAEVEWCVDWPSGSVYGVDEFIYKYQVTSTGTAPIKQFSVGMLDSNEANDIGYQLAPSPASQIQPDDAYFLGSGEELDQAIWDWTSLDNGEASYQLQYESVNAPTMDIFAPGRIVDDGTGAMALVPTPADEIPEPVTLGLLALGTLGMISRRGRKG
jgi:hypothetical protein